jgi:hypothetical protein
LSNPGDSESQLRRSRDARGFVSSNRQRNVEGRKVTMYAHWRTMQDYEQMRLLRGR